MTAQPKRWFSSAVLLGDGLDEPMVVEPAVVQTDGERIASVERTRKPRPVSSFWQKMHLKGHPRVVKMYTRCSGLFLK